MFARVSQHHPNEAGRIGRMLAGYSELEFGLFACINAATEEYDSLFKSMFRTRGETQRLDIADALGRHKFALIALKTDFEMALGGIRRCLKIRNQYAHSHWFADERRLAFIDMEEQAQQNALLTRSNTKLTLRLLTPELVEQQENFFDYVDYLLLWIQSAAEVKRGLAQENEYEKPKQEAQPLLYLPQD
jgi:hypothetical protein